LRHTFATSLVRGKTELVVVAELKSHGFVFGYFEADILVVALRADLDLAATPGLAEDGHEFYTGGRVVVGVTSTPFKCPPVPSETALLVHDFL
jgi:hypothetical protein